MNKILIIDDDHDFSNDLAAMLARSFRVDQAENSRQALRLFKKFQHDLCLIDVHLPAHFSRSSATEGLYLAEKIIKQNSRKKIIFISRNVFPKTQIDLPAYSFIKKPFKINTLLRMMNGL